MPYKYYDTAGHEIPLTYRKNVWTVTHNQQIKLTGISYTINDSPHQQGIQPKRIGFNVTDFTVEDPNTTATIISFTIAEKQEGIVTSSKTILLISTVQMDENDNVLSISPPKFNGVIIPQHTGTKKTFDMGIVYAGCHQLILIDGKPEQMRGLLITHG